MNERRKTSRLRLDARAVFRLFDGTWHESEMIDVGQGGMRLQSTQPVRIGTWLEMEIIPHQPNVQRFHCHGRVRWQNPRQQYYIVGVQLEGSSAQIRNWLSSLRTVSAPTARPALRPQSS